MVVENGDYGTVCISVFKSADRWRSLIGDREEKGD